MSGIGWGNPSSYAAFLQIQHAARLPIELWLADGAADADVPPVQSPLIAQDIRALGAQTIGPVGAFSPPARASRIGVAWAVAGSSLGNRMIARSLEGSAGGSTLPTAFLSDGAMGHFWKSMLPQLSSTVSPVAAAAARSGAIAVFDHFIATASAFARKDAA